MKTKLTLAVLTAMAATALAFTGCDGKKDVAVEKVTISESSLSLKTGEEVKLTATVLPENATNTTLVWKSGNPSVASVTDGVVKGLSEGTSTVTVSSEDGSKSASCLVSVSDYHAESVSITPGGDQNLKKGESVQLSASVLPDNAVNKNVVWSSSASAVASVDQTGKVTALSGGETTITVSTVDGNKTASVKVYVTVACAGIALSESSVEFYEGIPFTGLKLTFTPEDCSDKEVEWTYDTTILTVTAGSDGTLTLLGNIEGQTTLKATSKDGGFTAECTVKVLPTGTTVPDDNYGKYE